MNDLCADIGYKSIKVPIAVFCGATGFLVGVIGSLLSIRRFLKV